MQYSKHSIYRNIISNFYIFLFLIALRLYESYMKLVCVAFNCSYCPLQFTVIRQLSVGSNFMKYHI